VNEESGPFEWKVEERPELMVVGRAIRTTNEAEADPEKAKIPGLWEEIRGEDLGKKVPKISDPELLVAVLYSYKSDYRGEYSQLVGVPVTTLSEVPEGMNGLQVPAGSYAAIEVSGPMPYALIATWQQVWTAEDSGDLKRAYEFDYELHRGDSATLYLSVEPG
jgi:predicted transcriptional regulator YdeE